MSPGRSFFQGILQNSMIKEKEGERRYCAVIELDHGVY